MNAQSMMWNHGNLTVSKHFDNGFYMQNNTDNTLRIIIRYFNRTIVNRMIGSREEARIVFPTKEVSRNYTNQLTVSVFYDTECYRIDLATLKNIAQRRYNAAVQRRRIKATFRTIFAVGEMTPEDWWTNKWSKRGNAFMDGVDTYEEFRRNGLSEAFIKYVNGEMRSNMYKKISKQFTGSNYTGAVVNNLEQLHELINSDIYFETQDLEEAAKLSFTFIDIDPIYRYGIDFDNGFRQAVDPDGDNITNMYDDCPNIYGDEKYNGCTREIYLKIKREQRRLRNIERKRGYPRAILSAEYVFADYRKSNQPSYNEKHFAERGYSVSYEKSLLIHKFTSSIKSSFLLGGLYRKNGFQYLKDKDDELNFFNQKEAYVSLGYGLLIGANKRTKFMIEPKYGMRLYNDLSAGNITLSGNDVEKDVFVEQDPKTNATYKSIRFRLLFGGNSRYSQSNNRINAHIPIALVFGISQYTSSPIIVNKLYSSGIVLKDNNLFVDPENQFFLSGGISLNF